MKKIKILISSLIIIGIIIGGFLVYMIFFFKFFPVTKNLFFSIDFNKDYRIDIYYVDTGATSPSTIQIAKVYPSGKLEVIKNIEGYVDVKEAKILSNDQLKIIVGGKGKFSAKPDTFFVKIE